MVELAPIKRMLKAAQQSVSSDIFKDLASHISSAFHVYNLFSISSNSNMCLNKKTFTIFF